MSIIDIQARTTGHHPIPYPIIIIGIHDIKVPNTGTNPKINTSNASVMAYGKAVFSNIKPIKNNPVVVRRVLIVAIIL